MANVTEVNRLATFAKEQEPVELLEQDSRRLVNGTQDGLSIVCKLAQERADGP